MPDGNRQITDLELALDRYWDALLAGAGGDVDLERIDPALAAATRRIHGLDPAPSLRPAFSLALWDRLITAPPTGSRPADQSPATARGLPMQVGRRLVSPAALPVSRIAAAILLVLLLAGSAFVALYPLRQLQQEALPIVALPGTPTPGPGSPLAKPMLNLTLTELAPMRLQGGIDVTDYPAGASSQERTATGAEILFVASGRLVMTVSAAPQPVQVMQTNGDGFVASSRIFAAGQETPLEAASALLLHPGTVIELVNAGSPTARMLDLMPTTGGESSERDGAVRRRGAITAEQEISPPVSIVLNRLILAAGATIPAPGASGSAMGVAAVLPARAGDVRFDADRGWHNAGAEPIDLYVLRVTSHATPATPAAQAAGATAGAAPAFLWRSRGGAEPLVEPYGVGIDPAGNIWVADQHDRFQIIAPDGTYRETWGTAGSGNGELTFYSNGSGFARGYGDVAFDADGNIYVADTGNARVQKFTPDRTFIRAWGTEGKGDGQFVTPSGIAIGPDGAVYVSDEARGDVQKFNADGRFLGTIGAFGTDDGQFLIPAGVAVSPAGDVWVADYGNHRIQRFSAAGELLDVWGKHGVHDGELGNPNDLAVDALGRVYVADDGNDRLQVFAPDGRFLAAIGSYGQDPGQFDDALGISIGADETVYVSGRNGLQAFRLRS